MERHLRGQERLLCQLLVCPIHSAENGPAEFHAAFDNSRPVVAYDPLRRGMCESLRSGGRRIQQSNFIESEANLRVCRSREVVDRAKKVDM